MQEMNYFESIRCFNSELLESDVNELLGIGEIKYYQRKSLIEEPIQWSPSYYFVLDGLLRIFSIDTRGKEITMYIAEDKDIMAIPSYVFGDEAGSYCIEVAHNSKILIIEKDALEALCKENERIMEWYLNAIKYFFSNTAYRLESLLTKNASERLKDFVNKFPGLYRKIRNKHLATVIGVTPNSLSRILSSKL